MSFKFIIRFKKLVPDAVTPERKTAGAAGYDLSPIEAGRVLPGELRRLRTGITIELPKGTVGIIRPRSSRFAEGLSINGTIDEDYRGELILQVRNITREAIQIRSHERYAQLIVMYRYPDAEMIEAQELSDTDRETGGLGSTGKR